ncbi:hypothetical protein EVAR_78852_1 [Eumeta japonica]|uniref:Uncharacterized protein n=1 Tax=Eumeta variegata TaxID=151549 RepID=A0A4C1U3S4_EUMVA|nr:hypothetical protein EVAR_78852_1 [Eumeta japonica]
MTFLIHRSTAPATLRLFYSSISTTLLHTPPHGNFHSTRFLYDLKNPKDGRHGWTSIKFPAILELKALKNNSKLQCFFELSGLKV